MSVRARTLNTTDSFLFALATEDYDLTRAHPHPPGYPVFIALARIFLVFTQEANAALVGVSVLFGAVSIALLYLLVREFASVAAAALAAILFAASPNLLYNGALALSYTAEGATSIAVAWAAVRTRQGRFPFWALGVLFAVSLGLRQSSLFFLTPIVLWTLVDRLRDRTRLRQAIQGLASGAVPTFLLWFVPMLMFGGGFRVWLETTQLQSRVVVFAYTVFNSGWPAVFDNVSRLRIFTEADWILVWAAVPVLLLAVFLSRRNTGGARISPTVKQASTALLIWALPSLLFYTFIFSGSHNGPRGYILVVEPAFFAALAVLTQWLYDGVEISFKRPRASVSMGSAVLVLLLLLTIPFGTASAALLKKEVRDHDVWSDAWLGLKQEYAPNETALFASHSWGFAKWYFPEYVVWNFMPVTPDPAGTPLHFIMESRHHVDDVALYDSWVRSAWNTEHPIPPGIRTIIILDFQLAGENNGIRAIRPEIKVDEAHLASGWRLLVMHPDPEHPTVESLVYLDDRSPQPR